MEKLINGKIPANMECPYKERCNIGTACNHKGKEHSVPFSCGFARAFEIIDRK